MGLIKEINFAITAMRTTGAIKAIAKNPEMTFVKEFDKVVKKHSKKPAIIFENETITYGEFDRRANAYAHWIKSQNIKKGEVIALLMENRTDYVICWVGIIRAGCTAALINTHLSGKPLAHCLNISGAKHIILGAELGDQYATAADLLEFTPELWAQGGQSAGAKNLDEALAQMPTEKLVLSKDEEIEQKDGALYIYTSGTTGNPKAARISHQRMLGMMTSFAISTKAKPRDRNYIILPLYHSAGGVCAVGTTLLTGGAMVIKRKFSLRDFWEDVHRHGVTQFQYIGELCRYLLTAPPHPHERDHKIKRITGNGLRPEIWPEFQKRFNIPKILEFYGATEGNIALINFDGQVGAIGRIPSWARKKTNVEIVQFDIETEQPVRNPDGFCIKCGPGEVGEALGQIFDDNPDMPAARFEGYVGDKETKSKIMRDVFEKGDQWFRSGDLLKYDKQGYFYFIDRIGDTFRWKGENVATSEVSEVLSVFDGVSEVNVYGVDIPGTDGRAGMASMVVKDDVDLKKLYEYACSQLPAYARPVFLRMQKEIEITGTFKHRKIDLIKEGFDPDKISDPILFNDPQTKSFVPLDASTYDKIMSGGLRL